MIADTRRNVAAILRRAFFTGLLVILPSGLSVWLCWVGFNWIDANFVRFLRYLDLEPIRGAGFLFGLALVLGVGAFANNILGRRIVEFYENVLERLPIVNQLFPAFRQIAQLMLSEDRRAFDRVVLIEYPKDDCFVIGFLAAQAPGEIAQKTGHAKVFSVFVPTTPNPTSGFLLMVPEERIWVLEMTPDDGIKLVFSGGLLVPTPKDAGAKRLTEVLPPTSRGGAAAG